MIRNRVTIQDIAQQAGVSKMTVSKVLNNQGSISDATRDRVLKLARELGYVRNFAAHSLKGGRTNVLGMLVADGRPATVRLHPSDLELAGTALHEAFASQPLQWLADADVPPGGCRVEAAGTVIDGSLQKRWQRAIAPLGLASAWEDQGSAVDAPVAGDDHGS